MLYSKVGMIRKRDNKLHGNFIGYIERCNKIFKTDNFIESVTKRHLAKIKNKLNKI